MPELKDARSKSLFGSPVLEHIWPGSRELNASLTEIILAYAGQTAGEERTNVGGWHSAVGTLEFCGPAGKELVRRAAQMTEEATNRLYAEHDLPPQHLRWSLSAWANINRHGDFNNMHTHPGATWSIVYFVTDGESDPHAEGTPLYLYDPCSPRTNGFFPELPGSTFLFKPVPGLMVLFPGYMPHLVPPHRGDRPRISIAFNLRKDPFP